MTNKNAYAQSGVDVEAGYEVVERIKSMWLVRSVQVLWELLVVSGGMFDLSKTGVKEPVLISGLTVSEPSSCWPSSTTSTIPSVRTVAMCVNDIIAAGAEPLYFLDYVATGKNEPAKLEQVVAGVAEGCVQAGAASSVGKRLKCLVCMAKMTTTWLVLQSVWLKNLKSLTVQK